MLLTLKFLVSGFRAAASLRASKLVPLSLQETFLSPPSLMRQNSRQKVTQEQIRGFHPNNLGRIVQTRTRFPNFFVAKIFSFLDFFFKANSFIVTLSGAFAKKILMTKNTMITIFLSLFCFRQHLQMLFLVHKYGDLPGYIAQCPIQARRRRRLVNMTPPSLPIYPAAISYTAQNQHGAQKQVLTLGRRGGRVKNAGEDASLPLRMCTIIFTSEKNWEIEVP